jgi:hypothetical protein
MPVDAAVRAALTNPLVLGVWILAVAISVVVLAYDLRTTGEAIAPLMKLVWVLTVCYSGPLGVALYWYAGRTTIPEDTLWRRAVRSVAHCYSGCGAGEVVGIVVTAGLLAADTPVVVAATFACAYTFGYALTVGPLLQEGEGFAEAMRDAFYSETPSITVMEVVAIGTDVWLAAEATMGEVLFWSSLAASLTLGLLAAYPVNVLLIRRGVKAGMENPAAAGSTG